MFLLFPISFILFITYFALMLHALLFVIVYTYTYQTQSPNMALLSCLLRTLGKVIQLIIYLVAYFGL